MPVANAAALAGAIPGAKLRVLDGAGHLVFVERFADVNREVVTFLEPRGARGPERPQGTRKLRKDRSGRVRRWISDLVTSLGRLSRKAR